MKIGIVVERTGLSLHAIRFYERMGLLDERHVRRSENNYREFSEEAVEQVRTIKEVQAAGFTLAEFKELDVLCKAGGQSKKKAAVYIDRKIETVSSKIAELKQLRAYLIKKRAETKVA